MDNGADLPTFDPACPMSAFPVRIGGKWTSMVLLCLQPRPRRFTELRTLLGSISAKILTETLQAMERDGLVTRTAYDENPPRVVYELTALGLSLLPMVEAARAWARANLEEFLAARQRVDEMAPAGADPTAGHPAATAAERRRAL